MKMYSKLNKSFYSNNSFKNFPNMVWKLLLISLSVMSVVKASAPAFDQQLYEDVLDTELCYQQLVLLANHSLRYQFLDASFRVPSGLLTGNINDLGDYHQCLQIDQNVEDMQIQGKYCTIIVPPGQDFIDWPNLPDWNITLPELPDWNITIPELPNLNITWSGTPEDNEVMKMMMMNKMMMNAKYAVQGLAGSHSRNSRIFPLVITAAMGSTLAVCVPRPCSTRQALEFALDLVPFVDFTFHEYYCRLPGDKPFALVDYLAMGIFSFLGLLTVLSTIYDLVNTFHYKRK